MMAKSRDISFEFRQCIEKLFSSIVTLRQYFSQLDRESLASENEELLKKFRVSICKRFEQQIEISHAKIEHG